MSMSSVLHFFTTDVGGAEAKGGELKGGCGGGKLAAGSTGLEFSVVFSGGAFLSTILDVRAEATGEFAITFLVFVVVGVKNLSFSGTGGVAAIGELNSIISNCF